MLKAIKDSFKELFVQTKNFVVDNKSAFKKLAFFIVLTLFVFILSKTLINISFLDKLDVSNPENVAELQPLLDLEQRKLGLALLFSFFVFISVFIGRWRGFASVLGLGLSVFTIYQLIVPLLLLGWNPALVTFIGGTLVISGTLIFSHGINSKTVVSIIGSTSTLVVTLIIGEVFRRLIQSSGYYGEYSYSLLVNSQIAFDMGGIVLASIILSGIGLLDDVTVTQSSVVREIYLSDKEISYRNLYNKAMNVGRDHIGALINSLFWAYSSVSLPLLMLMQFRGVDSESILTFELLIEEILRTVVSTIGLVLAIPITTFIAVVFIKKFRIRWEEETPSHSHVHNH